MGTTLALGTISSSYVNWPTLVAAEMNFFRREKIEVEVRITGSSSDHLRQLEEGKIDLGYQAADHIIRAVDGGSDLRILMGINRPSLSLVVQENVKTFPDLRSKVLGVDGTSSGFSLLLKEMLRRNGLKDDEYTLMPIGASQHRYQALVSGRVHATLLDSPYDLKAVNERYQVLARTTEYFSNVQGTVAAARWAWAEGNRDILVRFIRAYLRALDWLKDNHHRKPATRCLASALGIEADSAERIYEQYIAKECIFCEGAQVEPNALRNLAKLMGKSNPDQLDISDYVNSSFLQKAHEALNFG